MALPNNMNSSSCEKGRNPCSANCRYCSSQNVFRFDEILTKLGRYELPSDMDSFTMREQPRPVLHEQQFAAPCELAQLR